MTFEQLAFYFLASVTVISAIMVVTVRNPVRAALFLILTFFTAACIWLLLEAEFLAIVLVLVYVGAVMVLFLFVVMMLDIDTDQLREGFGEYLPIGATVAVIILLQLAIVLSSGPFEMDQMPAPAAAAADYGNTHQLGLLIYTYYVYPFELAAVLLLLAIVAAISLGLRGRVSSKRQKPDEQVRVRKQDRLRIVKMNAEKQD
ncbi:MAG: NADH-quinone oxidoreductase subunit J [Gammaproteobacteria bacterium]|nr:NADH-quinone oxidoreductase subunit J [Gammaproteobacteria bacterium]MDX2487159.1 NADH-quinone oxidoreductase subunit J [Gammaproteobacteria bacterium]